MTRVAVLDDWQGIAESAADWSALKSRAEVVFFREAFGSPEALAKALAGFEVVIAMRERSVLHEPAIALLKELKLLVFTGVVNVAVDVDACTARNILVCNTSGARPSPATAELTLGLILAVARAIPLADAEMRAGRFQERVMPGIEMRGKTLGLVGAGKIGATVGGFCKAMGMKVIAWSQNLTDERAAEAGVVRVSKEELFTRSDVISVHVVLSERSRGIVGAEDIGRMKPGAILVNTSRSPLIDPAALLAALQERRIYAGIDVYDIEPLAPDHPLRSAPNTVLTPHLGYVSNEAMSFMYRECAEAVTAWLDGTPVRVVNPQILA